MEYYNDPTARREVEWVGRYEEYGNNPADSGR